MAEMQLSKSEAMRLLEAVAPEKAFYFYRDAGQPLDKSSKSLTEFADTVKEIDSASVKFHLERGDFENWFKMLGDGILPGQLAGLRGKNRAAEDLRIEVSSRVRSRVSQLQRVIGPQHSRPQTVQKKRARR